MKKYCYFIVLPLLFFMSSFSYADTVDDPVKLLSQIADQMMSALKRDRATIKSNPQRVYALAQKILVPHADIEVMSRQVLPRNVWDNATDAQKNQFEKEFTYLLVGTYSSALAAYANQKIRFFPIRDGYIGKDRVQVSSEIVQPSGPSIAVSYRLLNEGHSWKLYDLSVDGVSLIRSFRSQFGAQLSHGAAMPQLLQNIRAHNASNGL